VKGGTNLTGYRPGPKKSFLNGSEFPRGGLKRKVVRFTTGEKGKENSVSGLDVLKMEANFPHFHLFKKGGEIK